MREIDLEKIQKEYFCESKIRDASGNLLRVYHGAKTPEFDAFEYSPARQTGTDYGEAYYFTTDYEKAKAYAYDQLKDPRLIALNERKSVLLKKYDETNDDRYLQLAASLKIDGKYPDEIAAEANYDTGGKVIPVYLDIRHPLVVDAQEKSYYNVYPEYFRMAREEGYDGIIVKNVCDAAIGNPSPMDVYIAFYPDQIKHVNNLLPTRSKNYKDNIKDYIRENFSRMGHNEQFTLTKIAKEQMLRNQRDDFGDGIIQKFNERER